MAPSHWGAKIPSVNAGALVVAIKDAVPVAVLVVVHLSVAVVVEPVAYFDRARETRRIGVVAVAAEARFARVGAVAVDRQNSDITEAIPVGVRKAPHGVETVAVLIDAVPDNLRRAGANRVVRIITVVDSATGTRDVPWQPEPITVVVFAEGGEGGKGDLEGVIAKTRGDVDIVRDVHRDAVRPTK